MISQNFNLYYMYKGAFGGDLKYNILQIIQVMGEWENE